MFTGFTDETIRFFLDLKFHNNSVFFHENHERYVEEVQHVFYDMIDGIAHRDSGKVVPGSSLVSVQTCRRTA